MLPSEALDIIQSRKGASAIHARLLAEGRAVVDELPQALACVLAQRLADETRAKLPPLEEVQRNAKAVFQEALTAQLAAEKRPRAGGRVRYALPEQIACRRAKEELDSIEARVDELRKVIEAADTLRGTLLLMHWTPERAARLFGMTA